MSKSFHQKHGLGYRNQPHASGMTEGLLRAKIAILKQKLEETENKLLDRNRDYMELEEAFRSAMSHIKDLEQRLDELGEGIEVDLGDR